jgi:uncharacterized protein
MALIAKWAERRETGKVWLYLESVGKMALSCYVLQNVAASFLFYGWGLGWGGRLGSFSVILIWLAICVLEAVFAKWWIGRMKFGPVEWLRKSLLRRVAAN